MPSPSMPLLRKASACGLHHPLLWMLCAQVAVAAPAGAHEARIAAVERENSSSVFDDLVDGWSQLISGLGNEMAHSVSFGPVIVFTHGTCPPISGETADCAAAAKAACIREGYASGSNLDVVTGRICRAGLLSERDGVPDETCKPKTWITRALCW